MSFLIEDSNSESNQIGGPITPIMSSFELYFENDNNTDVNNELGNAKASHSTGVQSESRNVISNAMEFIPPYVAFEITPIERKRNNSEIMAPRKIPGNTSATKSPNRIYREPLVILYFFFRL